MVSFPAAECVDRLANVHAYLPWDLAEEGVWSDIVLDVRRRVLDPGWTLPAVAAEGGAVEKHVRHGPVIKGGWIERE